MSPEKLAEKLFLVFANKGYASTTISDLTQATGMKPASLYLAFGNKEGMYSAALDYYREHWLVELSESLQRQQLSFSERIHKFLLAAFTLFSCTDKPLGCIMTFSALAFHTDENGLAAQLRDERQAFTQWLEKEAIEAQKMGEIPGYMSPQAYACFILTLEKGLALNALEHPKKEVVEDMIDAVVTTLFLSKAK